MIAPAAPTAAAASLTQPLRSSYSFGRYSFASSAHIVMRRKLAAACCAAATASASPVPSPRRRLRRSPPPAHCRPTSNGGSSWRGDEVSHLAFLGTGSVLLSRPAPDRSGVPLGYHCMNGVARGTLRTSDGWTRSMPALRRSRSRRYLSTRDESGGGLDRGDASGASGDGGGGLDIPDDEEEALRSLFDVDFVERLNRVYAEEEEGSDRRGAYDPPDSVVEARTRDWIRTVVVGLNLCPFADRPLKSGRLTVHVKRGSDERSVGAAVMYEADRRTKEPGTSVVVAPEFHPDDFGGGYMDLVHVLNELMEERGLDGLVQVAPFHPLFEFEGSGSDGVDNFTNRSPYPMFHVLREDEVGKAVDKLGGDASRVWSRNVGLLQNMEVALGRDGVERAMKGESVEGLEEVLRETRKEFNDFEEKT